MPTRITENVLHGIFDAFQSNHLTTEAKLWNLPGIPTAPTIFVPGNNQLEINGQTRAFSNGAYVYELNGRLEAMPAHASQGGGITVDGGPVKPVTLDPFTNCHVGNMATLNFNEAQGPGTSQLVLRPPEGKGTGFAFRYPAYTDQQLIDLAQEKGAIVEVKGSDGKVLRGFFAKNSGGALPRDIGPHASGTKFDAGDFVSIGGTNDRPFLFTYKNYSPKELEDYKRIYSGVPGNTRAQLTTLDGQPLNPKRFPSLDVQSPLKEMAKIDVASRTGDGRTKGPDAQKPAVEGQQPQSLTPDANPRTAQVDGVPKVPQVDGAPKIVPANTGEGLSGLARIGRVLGPVALAALPVYEGISDGYQAYNKSGSAIDTLAGTGTGVLKGIADTYLPGVRDGYSNVVGAGDMTAVDRFLNAASDATGTATAVGATAMGVELAGVVTIPAEIPTGIATLAAGVSNLGINAVKGILKTTGLAGKDQDGGYIYDGAVGAVHGISHLIGWDHSESPSKAVSAGSETAAKTKSPGMDVDYLLAQTALAAHKQATPVERHDQRG